MSNLLDNQRMVFALLFKTANKLQSYLDKQLVEDGITVKQMFLMIMVHSFDDHQPTFREVSDRMGTSYQNVKQLALKLEKQNLMSILNDPNDRRAKRLSLTKKARMYWAKRDDNDLSSMASLFDGIDSKSLSVMIMGLMSIEKNIDKMREFE